MRIYTKCVYGWQPDGTLKLEESESFDYEGPLTLCKDSPDPPKPPDYAGAARETNESSRVNQYTPLGQQTWVPGHAALPGIPATQGHYEQMGENQFWVPGTPATPGVDAVPWESHVTLNPEVQRALDAQLGNTADIGELGKRYREQFVDSAYSKPMDLSSVGDIADASYKAQTSRLDPQWKQNEEMQRTQLTNQGLVPGGEAYDNAMRIFGNSKNDAYQQAILGSIATMPQTYQMASSTYNQPLNTMNSILGGSQVQMPQFAGQGPGANMLQAATSAGQYAQGLYGSQVAETNSANATTGAAAATIIAAMI